MTAWSPARGFALFAVIALFAAGLFVLPLSPLTASSTGPGVRHAPSPVSPTPVASRSPAPSVAARIINSCNGWTVCPFGVADEGNDGLGNYEYNTTAFESTTNWTKVSFRNTTTSGNDAGDQIYTDQLNVVENFTVGNQSYYYWIQDLYAMNSSASAPTLPAWSGCPSGSDLVFMDNIWNFTNITNITNHTGDGHGTVQRGMGTASLFAPSSSVTTYAYYVDVANAKLQGNCIDLSPTSQSSIDMEVVATLNEVYNYTLPGWVVDPGVEFEYRDSATHGQFLLYDSYNFTWVDRLNGTPSFVVANHNVPAGAWLYQDAENTIGGDNAGRTTWAQPGTDIELGLESWNGHNFQEVPAAWNFGLDTGEKATDVDLNLWQAPVPQDHLTYTASPAQTLGILWSRNTMSALSVQPFSKPDTTIPLGAGTAPEYTAVDTSGRLWISDTGTNTVKVIDPVTRALVRTFPVGSSPRGLVFDAYQDEMWVANHGSDNLTVISAATLQIVGNVPLGTGSAPLGLAYAPYVDLPPPGTYHLPTGIYVTMSGMNAVGYVTDTTLQLTRTFPVRSTPYAIVFDGNLYVTDYGSRAVSEIGFNANHAVTVIGNVSVGGGPIGEAVNGTSLFVTNHNTANVTTVDTGTLTVLHNTPVGPYPWGIAYYPGYNQTFVSLSRSGQLRALWAVNSTLVGRFNPVPFVVGKGPAGLTYDPADGLLFLALSGSNAVQILTGTTDQPQVSLTVMSDPIAVTYDPRNGDLYVANVYNDSVSVVSAELLDTLVTVNVGLHPQGIAFDAANGYLYVANEYSDNISVINGATNRLVTTLQGPGIDLPSAVAYDNHDRCIYVTDLGSYPMMHGNLTIINGTKVVATVPISLDTVGIAYDPANHLVALVSIRNGTLELVDGATVVAVTGAGAEPTAVAYDGLDQLLYVTDSGPDVALSFRVIVASGQVNVAPVSTTPVGVHPTAITYDPWNTHLYVPDDGGLNVSVISSRSNTVLSHFGLVTQAGPETFAFDAQNSALYAVQGSLDQLVVVSASTPQLPGTVAAGNATEPFIDGKAQLLLWATVASATYPVWANYTATWHVTVGRCVVKSGYTLSVNGLYHGCASGVQHIGISPLTLRPGTSPAGGARSGGDLAAAPAPRAGPEGPRRHSVRR